MTYRETRYIISTDIEILDKSGGDNVKLKELREARDITQMKLAELINVPQSTIATWETGRAFPRAEKLPAIAKALGCTVDELLQSPAESA